jgi:hypothetical protein
VRQNVVDQAAQPLVNLFRNNAWSLTGGSGGWAGPGPNAFDFTTPGTFGQLTAGWTASGKAWRYTWSTRTVANGDVGLALSMVGEPSLDVVTPGARITVVFEVVTSHDVTNSIIAATNVNGGTITINATAPNVTIAAGIPVRRWVTFTPGPGVTGIGSIRTSMTNLPLQAGVWAEVGNVDVYYGDYQPARVHTHGNLPGWRWRGTAWASEAVGYPDPAAYVMNRVTNPSAELGISGIFVNSGTRTRMTSGGRLGSAFIRCSRDTAGSISGLGLYHMNIAVTPGQTYTASAWVRSNRALSMIATLEQRPVGAGGNISGPVTPLTPNVWTRISVTGTLGPTTTTVNPTFYVNGPFTYDAGDYVDVDGTMVTEGATLQPYADGDTPGWRWTLAAHNSTSIGYPYTLESIAGPPLAVNTAPGTTVTYTAPPALAGRILYAVYDSVDPSQATSLPYAGAGAGATPSMIGNPGVMVIRHGSGNLMNHRACSINGTAQFANRPDTVGRHVTAGWMVEGDLGFGAQVDSGTVTQVTQVESGGMGTGTHALALASPHAAGTAIAAYLFAGEHDATTRSRVMAWLVRQHGGPTTTFTTGAVWASSVAGTLGTWTNTANALGAAPDSNRAVFTSATANETGYIDLAFTLSIPAPATSPLTSVIVSVSGFASSDSLMPYTAELVDSSGNHIGSAAQPANNTTSLTFTGVRPGDLATMRVRVRGTHNNSTTSASLQLDGVSVTVNGTL